MPTDSMDGVGQRAVAQAQMEDPLLWPQWSSHTMGSNDDDLLFNWNWVAPVQKDIETPSTTHNPLKRQRPLEMFDLASDTMPTMQVDNLDIANPFELNGTSRSSISSAVTRSPSSLFTVPSLPGSGSTSIMTTPASNTSRQARIGSHTKYDDDTISVAASPTSQLSEDSGKFRHVIALCKIVRVLEAQQSHQSLEPSSLDELMRVSRACVIDASRAMGIDGCRSCTSASMIMLLMFDLLLAIFEKMVRMLDESQKCVRPEETEGHGQQHQRQVPFGCSEPKLPTMQFGVLELDPEEQADFARKIVRKELQRLLETFKIFSAFCQSSVTNDGREMLRQWYAVLKSRLETLVSRRKDSSMSWEQNSLNHAR